MKSLIILIAASYVFFVLGNGVLSLTNPDEVFYVQTAKEMLQRHSWMTPYLFGVPQFEKPIFLYWLLRIGLMSSGSSDWLQRSASTAFVARLFPAMFAVLGVIATYVLARLGLKNQRKAFTSALVLMSSGLYIGLARTVYTDMIFSVFILLALTSFFWGYLDPAKRGAGLILFYVFSALAVLTKGPLGVAIPLLAVILFLAIRGEIRILFCRHSVWGFLLFLLVALPWYVFVIHRFGKAFTHEFFYNDHVRRLFEAEHPQNDRWYFYLGSTVIGMFPWSIFVLVSLVQLVMRLKKKGAQPIYLLLASWILVTFAVFQPAHSKLVSYIFPIFPAVAIMVGYLVCDWIEAKERRLRRAVSTVSCFTLAAIPIGLIAARRIYSEYLPSRQAVDGLILAFVALLIAMLFLIARKKLLECVYLLTLPLPVLFFAGLFFQASIDPYLSSKSACDFLLRNDAVENTVLSSKYFARGVHYFTGKEVAVVDVRGTGFFSPHPIPYLDTDEKVRDFLRKQPTAYCVVDGRSLSDLRRIAGNEMEVEVQKKTGNEYVVRVELRDVERPEMEPRAASSAQK